MWYWRNAWVLPWWFCFPKPSRYEDCKKRFLHIILWHNYNRYKQNCTVIVRKATSFDKIVKVKAKIVNTRRKTPNRKSLCEKCGSFELYGFIKLLALKASEKTNRKLYKDRTRFSRKRKKLVKESYYHVLSNASSNLKKDFNQLFSSWRSYRT